MSDKLEIIKVGHNRDQIGDCVQVCKVNAFSKYTNRIDLNTYIKYLHIKSMV